MKKLNPFAYLKEDHKKVAVMLSELEDTSERAVKTRAQVFEKLDEALSLHAKVEETIVYPVLEEVKATHDITLESLEEHHVIKTLLKELAATPESDETWAAKLKVLKENVEHHVEEEEGEMFPKAEKALTEEQMTELGEEIEAMMKEI